jgi:Tol biopolymer transport system component
MQAPILRKTLHLLVVIFLIPGMMIGQCHPAYAGSGVQVVVNGQPLNTDVAPVIVQGHALVPVRAVLETLGGSVTWDGVQRRVTGAWGGNRIALVIGSDQGTANGKPVALDVPAIIVDGRTMVPGSLISESLGAAVSWNSATNTVAISLPEPGQLVKLGPENIYNFSLIPGGKGMTFDSEDGVMVLQPDGSRRLLIGGNGFLASQATWSPDGRRIVLIGSRRGEDTGLWIANRDGSGLTFLAGPDDPLHVFYEDPVWSPDGQWIAFTRDVEKDYPTHGHYTVSLTIWVVKPDGTQLRRVTDGDRPTWSPDGQRLAFELRPPGPDLASVNGCEIYTCNLDGTNLKRVTGGIQPAWSPDGKSLAYVKITSKTTTLGQNAEGAPLCEVHWDSRDIWTISLISGKTAQLTESQADDAVADNWLQEVQQKGSEAGNNVLIASGLYDDWSPVWLPDGSGLIFSRNYNNEQGPHFVLYRIDLQ